VSDSGADPDEVRRAVWAAVLRLAQAACRAHNEGQAREPKGIRCEHRTATGSEAIDFG
jgi:hypothetical protein